MLSLSLSTWRPQTKPVLHYFQHTGHWLKSPNQPQVSSERSSEALQGCFSTTEFRQAASYNITDLQESTKTIMAYIRKYMDDVTLTKTISIRANQKPWLTGEGYKLLRTWNTAFRAGDKEDSQGQSVARHQTGQETVLQEDCQPL